MPRPKRPKRPRTARREQARTGEKLGAARNRLLDLEPGGTPVRPLEVTSAAVIEPKATSTPCPHCEKPFRVRSHEARNVEQGRLREVELECTSCGFRRSLWFRIFEPS
jgi:hypothetical protein